MSTDDSTSIYKQLAYRLPPTHFQELCYSLGIDPDSLPGGNVATKAIALFADIEQQGRKDEAIAILNQQIRQQVKKTVEQSPSLTALVILPRQEDMAVRLVPTHSLERLEEYRFDENAAYLLIGTFAGAILGILSNWATDENFTITRFSIVLMLLLLILTIVSSIWVRRLNQRIASVKGPMFQRQ